MIHFIKLLKKNQDPRAKTKTKTKRVELPDPPLHPRQSLSEEIAARQCQILVLMPLITKVLLRYHPFSVRQVEVRLRASNWTPQGERGPAVRTTAFGNSKLRPCW
jgi:hypothetical protein